ITGASKGLGEGIALELLHEEHQLICISRSESKTLKQMASARNCEVSFILFDLMFSQDIPQLCDLIFEKINSEDAEGLYLVNNAGVVNPVDRVENCPPEEVDGHMRINLLAPILLSAGFVERSQDWDIPKRILNISSGAAQNPYYGWSSYCTSKAGMDMFTRCLATEQETAKHPTHVMGVAPGIIDTDMQANIRSTTQEQFIHRQRFVDLKEKGQLVSPQLAGKHLAALMLSDDFKNGEITDIRHNY
ncbi:MAG: (S)-benzoin forming benzil reductase, partial [Bacteroidales bacterium]